MCKAAWIGSALAAVVVACHPTAPPEEPLATPLTSRMYAPPPPEGRDSLSCLGDDEPGARDKLREVASEYFSFRLEHGDVLDAEWEAVQRELLFGTRSNGCRRLSALLDTLQEGMHRLQSRSHRAASGTRDLRP